MPDVSTYWRILGLSMQRGWILGRAQCYVCEGMFTIGKNIFYRGPALSENMICDLCCQDMGNPTLRQIRKQLGIRKKKKRKK